MVLRIYHKGLTRKLIIVACGFFVFSPLSSVITQEILRLPLALPELLFIPFLILWRNEIRSVTFNRSIIWLFSFFIILIFISLLLHNFRTTSILSTSRGYLYMLISFSIFKGKNNLSIDNILLVSFGSVLGWCFVSIGRFIEILHKVNTADSVTTYGNLITLSLLVTISIVYGRRKYVVVAIIFGVILALTSGIRRPIVVFVISAFLSVFFKFNTKLKQSIRTLLIIAAIGFLLYISIKPIESFLLKTSPLLYQRIIVKTEQFLSGKFSGSDQYRSKIIKKYFSEIGTYLLPRGFVSKRTVTDNVGIYMDFPIIELSYMLGIFILAIFLISFFYYVFRHIGRYILFHNKESLLWAISGFVMFALLFLEGTYLTYAFITPFTGMIFGKIYTLKNLKESQPE